MATSETLTKKVRPATKSWSAASVTTVVWTARTRIDMRERRRNHQNRTRRPRVRNANVFLSVRYALA